MMNGSLTAQPVVSGPVLVIVAHADDAEHHAGGTIARLAGQGCAVYLAICTDGSKGSEDAGSDPAQLTARRQREQLDAAARLGIRQTRFLSYIDGELANSAEVRRDLVGLLRRIGPEVVIAHDPWAEYQMHPDHRAAGFAACDAVMAARNPMYFLTANGGGPAAHAVAQLWLLATTRPNLFINTEATMAAKLAALACHVSQRGHEPAIQRRVEARDREAGRLAGLPCAEPFRRLVLPATGGEMEDG